MRNASILASLCVVFLVGCGAAARPVAVAPAASPPPSPFPSAAELDRVAAVPARPVSTRAMDVPTWDLAGPFPDAPTAAPAPYPGPWGALLDEAARGGRFTPTADMHCIAREVGRFFLRHRALPAETLRHHIEGWCATPAVGVDLQTFSGDVPAGVSDEEVLAQWAPGTRHMLAAIPADAAAIAGLWYGREDGRAIVVVARAIPLVRLDATSLAPDADGVVVVRGALATPSSQVRVLVNRGRLAIAACSLDEQVALPRFEARCAVDPADPTAWIELSALPPGRILGKAVLRLLARRAGAAPSFAMAEPFPAVDGAAQASGGAALADLVNRARSAAGLPTLAIADDESALATRLAPHFFGPLLDGDPAGQTDVIALGLMAGWQVPAPVADAGLYSSWTASSDARYLIAAALDSPLGRSVLLDPDASHLAVGGVGDGGPSVLGGLFVTYQTVVEDATAATRAVLESIQAARAAAGLPPLHLLGGMDADAADVAAQLRTGAMTPDDALHRLLAQVARRSPGVAPEGWLLSTPGLDKLELPDGARTPGDNAAVVLAAPYRPAGEPWWRWAVVIVVVPR